jgi:hypothetical protein
MYYTRAQALERPALSFFLNQFGTLPPKDSARPTPGFVEQHVRDLALGAMVELLPPEPIHEDDEDDPFSSRLGAVNDPVSDEEMDELDRRLGIHVNIPPDPADDDEQGRPVELEDCPESGDESGSEEPEKIEGESRNVSPHRCMLTESSSKRSCASSCTPCRGSFESVFSVAGSSSTLLLHEDPFVIS